MYVYADSGKNFQSLIHIERLPYTWGEFKYGKLGLDLDEKSLVNSPAYSKKQKSILAPVLMDFFNSKREECCDVMPPAELTQYRRIYNKLEISTDVKEETLGKTIEDFRLRFPVQKQLKLQD